MEYADYVDALAADGTALAAAIEGHYDRPVPHCPDWVAADLLSHMGRIYWWVAETIRLGGRRFEGERPEAPEATDARLAWYQANLEAVIGEFGHHAAGDPAWTFSPSGPQEVGWWARRQALETAIHRYDAQAAGRPDTTPDPVEAELAVEGIDEFVTTFLPNLLQRPDVAGLTGSFHLHATDAEGEWWIDFDDPKVAARREHAKADTALRGPASGLYLWVWNRQSAGEAGLDSFGNTSTIDAWASIRV